MTTDTMVVMMTDKALKDLFTRDSARVGILEKICV